MRIFLTGATGFIGTAVIPELLAAGHQVLGLTRSDTGAQALKAAGAEAHLGTLEQPETLASGAEKADAVIHCAFDHDFTNFAANCEKDKRVIEAMGAVLAGSDRPFVITSGTGVGSPAPGVPATEDVFVRDYPHPRIATELAADALLQNGLNISIVRLPQVHNPVKQGLITPLIEIFRGTGKVAYVADGANRWPAAHVSDVAQLYRLAVERQEEGARYNAVAEEGVTTRDIAEVLGRGLGFPVVSVTGDDVATHFGWMAMFAGLDMPASSAQTRQKLGWTPTGPGLIADLLERDY